MYNYDVWVRSERYRRNTALTYRSDHRLEAGALVRVSLQRQQVTGVVVGIAKGKVPSGVKEIEHIYKVPPLPAPLLKLGEWLVAYYRSPLGAVAQSLTPAHLPTKLSATQITDAESAKTSTKLKELPKLNSEQDAAIKAMSKPGSYLLHGRTGSGKTRVYQEVTKRTLAAGQSVIILSPEIGLTTQLADSFTQITPYPVVVFHSRMTAKDRFLAWLQIAQSAEPLIIVGARSALFSPLAKIGLIIVDECHEPAYKQEQEPRYHTARVAATLRQLHQATLVYGSATPPVSDYYLAEQTKTPILELTKLAVNNNVALNTAIIDIKDRNNFSRSAILSNLLLDAVGASIERGEQSLLFLNRRGTALVSLCQRCGWQALCPHCDLPMTYHSDTHLLRCHACSQVRPAPTSCPVCHHTELTYRGVGTKALVSEVNRLFPAARVMRFDSDNTHSEAVNNHYEALRDGQIDILVGTQTLAKGFDLPRLSTLGVVTADTSLLMPDYTASERSYQLLQQVMGRVGRGHRNSTAVVQTYQPDSSLLKYSIRGEWDAFYRQELAERKLFHFPPFFHLLVIRCRRATAKSAEKACQKVITILDSLDIPIEVNGPAPSFHEKSVHGYTWQIVVKSPRRQDLLTAVDHLPATVTSYDLDPVNLL